MSTWAGWEVQLLLAAGVPNTAQSRRFLDDWSKHAETDCKNNPIDLSHQGAGSSDCKRLTGSRTAQNYSDNQHAAGGFANELHSGTFGGLLGAFRSGSPYNVNDATTVYNELRTWGSLDFANYFLTNYNPPSTGGGHGGSVHAPQALKGWHSIQHSVNRNMPRQLRHSQRMRQRALRALGRARRVKL